MLEALDSMDRVGGSIKVEDLGEIGVEWNDDGTLVLDGVDSLEKVDAILRYIKVGPKMEKTLEKLRGLKDGTTRQAVQKPVSQTATPAVAKVVEEVSATPDPDSVAERRKAGKPTTTTFPVTTEAKKAVAAVESVPPPAKVAGKPGLNPKAALAAFDAKAKSEAKEAAPAETPPPAEEKPKRAKRKSKPKEKPTIDPEMAQAMEAMATTFKMANPEAAQDVPELTDEQREKLAAAADKVNAVAEKFDNISTWQIPLEGETYDSEGVEEVGMGDTSVTLRLASGTVVEVDFEGNEIRREVRDAPQPTVEASKPLPQELGTTTKVSELVQHFVIDKGFDKPQTLAALDELKTQGHPALVNVADIEKRVGAML